MSWRRLPSTNDYTTTLTLHLGWPLTKARWGWSCFPRLVVLVYLFRIVYLHLMFSYAWHLFPCKTGNLLQSPFFLRVAEIGQITGSFLAWLPARWYWNPDQSHFKLREDLSTYLPQFKSRLLQIHSLYRFQKLVKKMPFNNILPQVVCKSWCISFHGMLSKTKRSGSWFFLGCSSQVAG